MKRPVENHVPQAPPVLRIDPVPSFLDLPSSWYMFVDALAAFSAICKFQFVTHLHAPWHCLCSTKHLGRKQISKKAPSICKTHAILWRPPSWNHRFSHPWQHFCWQHFVAWLCMRPRPLAAFSSAIPTIQQTPHHNAQWKRKPRSKIRLLRPPY